MKKIIIIKKKITEFTTKNHLQQHSSFKGNGAEYQMSKGTIHSPNRNESLFSSSLLVAKEKINKSVLLPRTIIILMNKKLNKQ